MAILLRDQSKMTGGVWQVKMEHGICARAFIDDVEANLRAPGAQHALMPDADRAGLMLCFMSCFGQDRQFVADFRKVFEKHEAMTTNLPLSWLEVEALADSDLNVSMQTYISNIRKFASSWGLGSTQGNWGVDALHVWCVIHSEAPSSPMHIGVKVWGAKPTPQVGDESKKYEGIRIPIVRATLEDVWYANHEPRAKAKQRLMANMERMIDTELNRVTLAYEQAGYEFQDKQPMLVRNIRWLYRRVAYRESCDVIAAREDRGHRDGYNSQFVQRETKKLADKIGLTIPRPNRRSTF